MLGIHVDSELRFDTHVLELRNKLNKAGFVIRKLAKFLSKNELKVLYYSHAHSHVTYGITLWGSLCSKKSFDVIYKAQKQLVRAVGGLRYRDHCMPCFKSMRVLTLSDQLHLDCLQLMYKVNSACVPLPISNMFRKLKHSYNTRNSKNAQNIKHTTSIVNRSFLNKAPILWQHCNAALKNKASLASFKSGVKKYCFEKY